MDFADYVLASYPRLSSYSSLSTWGVEELHVEVEELLVGEADKLHVVGDKELLFVHIAGELPTEEPLFAYLENFEYVDYLD